MITEFSQAVCEQIGYYVYLLKDPRTNKIFYVGKGKENRIFQHVLCSLNFPCVTDKLALIQEIGADKVEHFILRHGLTAEQAFEIESACIDLLGLDNLTNAVRGHKSWERGIKTINEVIQHYDAQPIMIEEPSIIININRLYPYINSEQGLYDAVRSSWKVGNKRNKAKYAIASYKGLVREIYEIESWQFLEEKKRWEFIGHIAATPIRDKYLNQSLANYVRKGNQNPIRYTF